MTRYFLFVFVLAAMCAAHLCGQSSDGRITGVILDSSGALVPGAKVTARNVDTGVERTVQSNSEGSYTLYPLLPGTYSLAAEATGFRAQRIDGISLEVAGVVARDVTMQVGAVQQEAMVVSASAAPMLTESVSVESTIVRDQIESLPLNGRDFNQLVLLTAGTVENVGTHDFGPVASNGNRSYSNSYLVDSTPNNDAFQAKSGAALSVDVIREFKVIAGVAPAEYGRGGTQVTLVTRSGGNAFHGSGFEYHRGVMWQARDPFNPGASQPFDRNQFGGSLGGPIRRNHTFFFVNYEGNRQSETRALVNTVPADAYWKGDFSSLLSRNISLRDPMTTGRPVFPGNILPASRLDATALKLRPFWGSPSNSSLANNLTSTGVSTNTADQFTTRADHTLPGNNNLMFRYSRTNSDGFTPSQLGKDIGTGGTTLNNNASLGWTAPFSSGTVNEARLGYSSMSRDNVYVAGSLPTTETLGIQGFGPVSALRSPMPKITFAGTDAFSSVNYGPNESFGAAATSQTSKNLTLSDSLTHVRGRHTLKAGFEYSRLNLPSLLQPGAGGQLTFRSAGSANSSGYTFADLMLGIPTSSQQVPPMAPVVLKQRDISSYIQDDWRISRSLTLVLGVRHELVLNPFEEKNRFALFDPATGAIVVASDNGKLPVDQYQPDVVAKLSDGKGNWRFPVISDKQAGFNPRRLIDTQWKNFGPRFGFVQRLNSANNFLLRGGYGIFYSRYPYQYLEQSMSVNPPFSASFTYSQSFTNGVPAITLSNPYSGASTASIAPSGLQHDFKLPGNQQWNLTLERELGWSTAMSLGYVGNKGTHLFRSSNANGPYLDPVSGQVVRQYTNTYGNVAINLRRTDGNSIYNAMQAELRRRTSKGLLFQANWTWAKGLDNVGPTVNASALDVENLGRDRADSDYVRRHMLKLNATYDLPFGRGKAFLFNAPRWLDSVVGGWRLAGLWTYNTGNRFTPQFTTAGALSNGRPDVVYGENPNLPRDQRSPAHWFNVAAFKEVPAVDPVSGQPRYGNAGRNILLGPTLNVADTSLAKSFPLIRERVRLTFRAEMFNMLNHPNYDIPENNISNVNTVGTISSTIRPMRQAQFALRCDF
jgi:hypothetical protein